MYKVILILLIFGDLILYYTVGNVIILIYMLQFIIVSAAIEKPNTTILVKGGSITVCHDKSSKRFKEKRGAKRHPRSINSEN